MFQTRSNAKHPSSAFGTEVDNMVYQRTSTFECYCTVRTCLLKPADKLATVSFLPAVTSSFFGRIIPFENSVNKNGQLYITHTLHKNVHTLTSKWLGSTDLRKILNHLLIHYYQGLLSEAVTNLQSNCHITFTCWVLHLSSLHPSQQCL